MKRSRTFLSGLFVALVVVLPSVGASGNFAKSKADAGQEQMLVSVDWLSKHFSDPSFVLLHISKKEEYDAAHIPGAQYLEYHDISTPHGAGLMLELPPMAQLVSVFEKLGISNKSRVILYFGNDWVSPTTRVYWTIDTMGLGPRTSILDGGLPAWRAAGKPLTTEVKTATQGSITPEPRTDIFADAAWVSSHLNQPNVTILDARNREFYTGEKSDGNPRQGHIPGASNLPFPELVDEKSSKFKNPDAIQELFENAGLKPSNLMVSYCHIGQRATVLYFAAKMLGYHARMYDGSWEEWSKSPNLPIVRGDKPGKP
ncbi:MAG TPA: sulfurtransferase [Candidatus Dormibacteraeota bacterium]|nr:sulfurtransferase [Candidatus Dormibacteraeota bacterium]